MTNVLLTYGWVRSSYAALRNLAKHRFAVIVSDSSYIGMSQFSKFKTGFENYTSHYQDEEKFIEDLLDICQRKEIDLIFPSHNETEIIAKHRNKFDPRLVRLIPDEDHCRIFNNKSNSYDLVNSLGVPTPKRIKYKNPKQISQLLEKEGLNITVIKLLTGNSGKGVFYADSPSKAQSKVIDLINKYELSEDRYPQVEEYVEGDGFGCSVFYWKGKLIASFTHRRLRDKIETGGTSTLRKASSHKAIEEAAKKIFDSIGWNGLAMCEFKICPKSNKYWFIEVNPRMWGSIPLAIAAGVEFPALACICATKGPAEAVRMYEQSLKSSDWTARWLLGDIFVAANYFFKLKLFKFKDILLKDKADSLDDFFWDDPLVFIGQILFYIKKGLSKFSFNPSEKGMLR